MFDTVHIGPYQKYTDTDLNDMGLLAREADAAQTRQFLARGLVWDEFNFTKNGFQLTVSVGDLWKDGEQYRALTPTTFNFVADSPPQDGLKRIIAIVAYANPAKLDEADEREFAKVVTPATNSAPAVYQTETRTTLTRNRQSASVAKRTGDIAPEPTAPNPFGDECVIALVVLSRSGIDRVDPVESTRTPNLGRIAKRVDDVESFVVGTGGRLEQIDKNLAALAGSIGTATSEATLRQMTANLAVLNETTRAKVGDLGYNTDLALDKRWTDINVAGYAAEVQDGIRFPFIRSKETPISLFDPTDKAARLISGLLMADFVEEPRIFVAGMDQSATISSQIFTETTVVKTEYSRSVVRTGPAFTVCNNAAFWQSGQYDAANEVFRRNGETFTAQATGVDFGAPVGYAPGTHIEFRLQKQWTDTWADTRWDKVVTNIPISGAMRSQSFRPPDFGFLSSIDLPFTKKDSQHPVTLMLCETAVGSPNIKRVLEVCTLQPASIVADAKGLVRTKFPFRPSWVDPSKLYCWVTVTRGAYEIAQVKNNKYAGGTSFISTDNGEFFVGDLLVDWAFTANFAKFKSPRVELRLNDLDNIDGDVISALKFLYASVIPAGCKIVHLIKRSGGTWTPVAQVTKTREAPEFIGQGPFDTLPLPVGVQHMVVLIGTVNAMPALDLTQAWATTLRLGDTLNHYTPVLNFGATVNRAEVQVTVDGPFDPAKHTNGCKLVVNGASVNPLSATPAIDPNKPGKRIITYAYSFADTTGARVNLTGLLNSILSAYHVDNRFIRTWKV